MGDKTKRIFGDRRTLACRDGGEPSNNGCAWDAKKVEALNAGEDCIWDLIGFGGREEENDMRGEAPQVSLAAR